MYNKYSGKKNIDKYINYICEKLKTRYEIIELYMSDQPGSITCYISQNGENYEFIAVVGGDGTISEAVNGIMNLKRRPTLGCIPTGTCNDASKTLGLSRNIKKTMKIILQDNKTYLDVNKINDRYFVYGMAIGNLINISFDVNYKLKKKLGRFAYYIEAVKNLNNDKSLKLDIVANGKRYSGDFFLFLATNSRYLASFKLRKKRRIYLDNNKLSVVLINRKNRLINLIDLGLYLLLGDRYTHNITSFESNDISIELKNPVYFNLDGEKAKDSTKINVKVLPEQVEVIVSRKVLRKHFNKLSSF